jgi:polysaccharide pyruvyl transferase WcaK-like protein
LQLVGRVFPVPELLGLPMSHAATIAPNQDRILPVRPSAVKRKIGILGHFGTKNLGDEAIVASLIQNTRLRYPEAEIICFSARPQDTEERHGVAAFPIRRMETPTDNSPQELPTRATDQFMSRIKAGIKRVPVAYASLKALYNAAQKAAGAVEEVGFLRKSARALQDTELLLIAGSQQLSDHYGGPWGFPYTLLKWSLLAKAKGARIAFVGLGAGPIHSPVSRFFLRRALSLASYRSFRTADSRVLIGPIHGAMNDPVMPDSVYSMHVSQAQSVKRISGRPVIGINPVPYYDSRYWHASDPAVYSGYVQKMASFADWLVERGYKIWFFPTQLVADPLVIADIKSAMKAPARSGSRDSLVDWPVTGLENLVTSMSSADIIVANRFHGVLVPFLLGKPVLALAYHKKTQELMAQMGLAQYSVDNGTLDVESMKKRFLSLEAERGSLVPRIAGKVGDHRRMLDAQYDSLFDLLENKLLTPIRTAS